MAREVVSGQQTCKFSSVTSRRRVRAVSATSSRRTLLLAGLWLTAAAAEWAALRPVIFQEHVRPEVVLYHVVGASFAACGLLAWHRRLRAIARTAAEVSYSQAARVTGIRAVTTYRPRT